MRQGTLLLLMRWLQVELRVSGRSSSAYQSKAVSH